MSTKSKAKSRANFGWKITKSLGIFADTEYTRMWDSKMFITSFGLNYTFR